MGRASREQAERNRERVVATACSLFRQHGVENVSIADVMHAAGLTPGGFYKQFASKDALIDEAFALAFQQSADAWDRLDSRHDGSTPYGLEALVRHYFKPRPKEYNCPILVFASQVSNLPASTGATDVYGHGVEALFSRFRAAATSPAAGPDAAPAAEQDPMVLFAAMIGAGLLARSIGQTELVQQIQAAVIAALPKPQPDSHDDAVTPP